MEGASYTFAHIQIQTESHHRDNNPGGGMILLFIITQAQLLVVGSRSMTHVCPTYPIRMGPVDCVS